MKKWHVDFNCDVGEGIGNEAQLFPFISSCNIACGGHAGNTTTISDILKLAMANNVKIGAHPSYPDKANFGRKVMEISNEELRHSLSKQLATFYRISNELEAKVHHIKPHGALYNIIAKDQGLAALFLQVVEESNLPQRIYAQPDAVVAHLAKIRGIDVCYEAFADRNYNEDGSLVSRAQKDALISEPKHVLQHILPIIQKGEVVTLSGNTIQMQVDTICVHGDTPTALQILEYLSKELRKHNVVLSK
ncbi:MAG: 5-oxoprolinase subunit PxpA [Bacteroidota bacterium]